MRANRDEIFNELKKVMLELFEIDPNVLQLDTNLYDTLDLDSIDAVDLIAHLQTLTGRKFSPEEFKAVRTISDVVDVIYNELNK